MEQIEISIKKLKEHLGYELDYEWNETNPPIKKEPEVIDEKDKLILKILDDIYEYLEQDLFNNNGFYY